MTSPLDQSEVDALMAAIQDGRVAARPAEDPDAPVVPYDLTSQDRIIRGQMPTLDSINEQVAVDLRLRTWRGARAWMCGVAPAASTLMKFVRRERRCSPAHHGLGGVAWAGHGLACADGRRCRSARALLSGGAGRPQSAGRRAPSDRDAGRAHQRRARRAEAPAGHLHLAMAVRLERRCLRFRPEVLRFDSDPRMAMVAPPTDLAILCSYEVSGAATGRVQIAIPYATVEPVKKLLTSPPRRAAASTRASRPRSRGRSCENVKVERARRDGRATV